MKAILEALRKEVRQINAGTSDPSLTSCDTSSQQRTRNASSQTVFSPEWSQGIQELQKRSVKLRRDRYKFGRNKIIRERERNLSRSIAGPPVASFCPTFRTSKVPIL